MEHNSQSPQDKGMTRQITIPDVFDRIGEISDEPGVVMEAHVKVGSSRFVLRQTVEYDEQAARNNEPPRDIYTLICDGRDAVMAYTIDQRRPGSELTVSGSMRSIVGNNIWLEVYPRPGSEVDTNKVKGYLSSIGEHLGIPKE